MSTSKSSIEKNFEKVSVIGQGYVGLPLALLAADQGWIVNGVEVDESKFNLLQSRVSPIENISNISIEQAFTHGRYNVSANLESIHDSDIVVICVPTPLNQEGLPNLDAIRSAVSGIVKYAKDGALVINESTSYPGTLSNEIEKVIMEERPDSKMQFAVAPERVDPGNAFFNQENTPRVIGGTSDKAIARARDFYGSFCSEIVVCENPETAEMAKLLENAFRLVNIVLVNEIADICLDKNIDVFKVINAASSKPYGFMPFYPSLGIGGHCIPIDPAYLNYYASEGSQPSEIVELALKSNIKRISRTVDYIRKNHHNNGTVQIIGIGYKRNTKDIRESSAIKLIQELRKHNFEVKWFDPIVESWNGELSSIDDSPSLVVVNHPYLDPKKIKSLKCEIMDFTGTL